MLIVTCIQKFKKNNKIIGYRLQDKQGNTRDVYADPLKAAIRNNQITVDNLTLTSDDRLVDSEQNKQNKKQTASISVAWAENTDEIIKEMIASANRRDDIQDKKKKKKSVTISNTQDMLDRTLQYSNRRLEAAIKSANKDFIDIYFEDMDGEYALFTIGKVNNNMFLTFYESSLYANMACDYAVSETLDLAICKISRL